MSVQTGARAETGAPKRINLALQGGGSHGALTWGVLDRLLEDERLEFEGISGASAGAINGALLVYGLADGGRQRAREVLAEFWERVGHSSVFGHLPTGWLEALVPGLELLTHAISPYQFNPLNLNPLRGLIEEAIDFRVLTRAKSHKLFVGATNVRRGAMRVFETREMSVDALLASACLPFLFQAVEIEGEPYWDGGYLGNPTLYPLVRQCASRDIVIVRINPCHRDDLPKDAGAITDRMNEISFNAALQSEIEGIELINYLLETNRLSPDGEGLREILLHQIGDEARMAEYGAASKMSTDPGLLRELHALGRETAGVFLAKHFKALGQRSTFVPEHPTGHRRRVAMG